MKKTVIISLVAMLLVTFTGTLAAHPIHDEVTTFSNGLVHPLTDWGYLLSVIVIGLWVGWRSAKLSIVDMISWIAIGLFLAINGYLHAAVVTHFTWAYSAGMILSNVALLCIGMLLSVKSKQEVLLSKQ